MPRGGQREGAGRKVGMVNAATLRTRAVAEKARAAGINPLEVMLDNMRHFQKIALDAEAILAGLTAEEFTGGANLKPEEQFKLLLAEVKKAAGFRQMAHDCATDAAPYMHHRLQAIQHSGDAENPIAMTVTWKPAVKESTDDPKAS
jgi:hypothetical protein